MKKTLSVLLATAMLCGAVHAYDISDGALQAAPAAVQTDLSAGLTALGLDALTVTGASDSSTTARLGEHITVFAAGSATGTRPSSTPQTRPRRSPHRRISARCARQSSSSSPRRPRLRR